MKNKIKKIFEEYKQGYFPNKKDCDICAFTIPVLELLEQDITNCVNSAPKDNSQQPSELNQHAGGEYD